MASSLLLAVRRVPDLRLRSTLRGAETRPNLSSWISGPNLVLSYVPRHYGARTDDRAPSDRNAFQDSRPTGYPHVVGNGDPRPPSVAGVLDRQRWIIEPVVR